MNCCGNSSFSYCTTRKRYSYHVCVSGVAFLLLLCSVQRVEQAISGISNNYRGTTSTLCLTFVNKFSDFTILILVVVVSLALDSFAIVSNIKFCIINTVIRSNFFSCSPLKTASATLHYCCKNHPSAQMNRGPKSFKLRSGCDDRYYAGHCFCGPQLFSCQLSVVGRTPQPKRSSSIYSSY